MQMTLCADIPSSKMEISLEHGGETLLWNVSAFHKTTMIVDYDLFSEISQYWNQLPEQQTAKIFSLFKSIRQAFDEIPDRSTLSHALAVLVSQLAALQPLEDIRQWVLFKSKIYIPDTLNQSYIENNDKPTTREGTYVRGDYVELVCYSLALRMMVPIWGEYILRTRQEAGTKLQEYYAYKLLSHTELATCPALIKLTEYIDSNTPEELPTSAIVDGVSSEEYPIWILALVVVRRVCVGDIRGLDPNPKLVSYIYKFIASKVKGSDGSFSGIVKDKKPETSNGDDDQGVSKFESYKIRQDITLGDRAYHEHVLSDILRVTQHICPSVTPAMLNAAMESSKILANSHLSDGQVSIARWIFRPVVSPRAFMYFNKQTVIRTLAASQCILWEWGFKDIGALITAVPTACDEMVRIGSVDTKRFAADLNALYPYQKRSTSKAKTNKPVNHAVQAIELVSLSFSKNDWLMTVDDKLLQELGGGSGRRIVVPANIRSRLSMLILERISKATASQFNAVVLPAPVLSY